MRHSKAPPHTNPPVTTSGFLRDRENTGVSYQSLLISVLYESGNTPCPSGTPTWPLVPDRRNCIAGMHPYGDVKGPPTSWQSNQDCPSAADISWIDPLYSSNQARTALGPISTVWNGTIAAWGSTLFSQASRIFLTLISRDVLDSWNATHSYQRLG